MEQVVRAQPLLELAFRDVVAEPVIVDDAHDAGLLRAGQRETRPPQELERGLARLAHRLTDEHRVPAVVCIVRKRDHRVLITSASGG